MENVVFDLKDKISVEQAIKFVERRFLETEKNFYTQQELNFAHKALKDFDIFDCDQLEKLIKLNKVKVFVGLSDGKICGVCGLEIQSGKILFLTTSGEKNGVAILKEMVEKMVEERSQEPDNRLNIMAFAGQEKELASVGFRRLYDTVLFYHGVKFVPMKYSYTQFDIEK